MRGCERFRSRAAEAQRATATSPQATETHRRMGSASGWETAPVTMLRTTPAVLVVVQVPQMPRRHELG